MSPTIVAAIIAGVVAIVAPIITLVAKEILEQKPFSPVTGRRKALVGKWHGILKEAKGPGGKPLEVDLTFEFTKHRKRILGRTTFTLPGRATRTLDFTGGFLHEQFLKLDYNNPDPTVMQFGCYVAKLITTDDQKVLDGRFVGYGPDTGDIVHGTAVLNKGT
jgi:hypothetical protein